MQSAVIQHTLPEAQKQNSTSEPLAAKLQVEAALVCVRAMLTAGRDKEAVQLVEQV